MSVEDKYFRDLVPLTKKETAMREKLEEKIFLTVREFYVEIGDLLGEIQAKRLYRSTHQTFADYSREVLDMAKSSAYRYIEAAEVVRNLRAIAHENENENVPNWGQSTTQPTEIIIPQNESQARALVELKPEEQRKVWFEAVETAPEGKITAAHVRKTVRELGLEKVKKTVEKVKRAKEKNKARISDDFDAAFKVFLAAVQNEITSNWKTTDRLTVVKHLDGIRGAISANGNHLIPEKGYAIEASNIEKLQAAGFTLYRADKKRKLIETHSPDIGWMVFDTYEDVEAMGKAFDELLKEQNNLRG